jgi:hypothetical protein
LGIFTRSIANMTSGKEGRECEWMLLDSIIMCIAYLTSAFVFGISQEVLLSMATMGRGGWVRAGFWTAS